VATLVVGGAAMAASAGCQASGSGKGIGVYSYGGAELTDTETVSLDAAYAATLAALKGLEYRITDQTKDALGGQVFAATGDDTTVRIRLALHGDNVTQFYVRYSFFGNQEKSRVIMDRIRKSL
jgi:hypothetical protein